MDYQLDPGLVLDLVPHYYTNLENNDKPYHLDQFLCRECARPCRCNHPSEI